MRKKGEEVLNLNQLGGIDPALPEVAREAVAGKSGIKTYKFEDHTKIVAYAPVPFYTADYPKPAGFGWVGMAVDVEKFLEQAKLESGKIEKEAQVWLTTIILIIFGAMVILFSIAVILSRASTAPSHRRFRPRRSTRPSMTTRINQDSTCPGQ